MALCSDSSGKKIIEYSPDQTFDALKVALENAVSFKIKDVNKSARTISIKTGVSMKSWGENLLVTVNPASDGMAEVLISSGSKMGLVDWGKNQDNVNSIMSLLASELDNGLYEKVQNSFSTQDIPDQIKKLSELKDAGILTDEEFQSKKSQLLEKI